jgi:predicted phosphoribosyltransferase
VAAQRPLIFRDRADAARRLAQALAHLARSRPLVLAIPRGAVPMGRIVADALGGELDVVLVRKLGSPFSAEFAVGAIDESGWTYVAPYAESAGADAGYLARERERQLGKIRERRAACTPARAPIDPQGRVVVVIDDGLATGATMIAALHALAARKPARLVCAVPVAAPDSLAKVRGHCDELVCLSAPADFQAVGQFYEDFPQVEDEEVVRLLAGPPAAREGAPDSPRS